MFLVTRDQAGDIHFSRETSAESKNIFDRFSSNTDRRGYFPRETEREAAIYSVLAKLGGGVGQQQGLTWGTVIMDNYAVIRKVLH